MAERATAFTDLVTSPDRAAAYQRDGLWDSTTLAGQVEAHARSRPDRLAVVDQLGRRTWRDLHRDASRLAGWLVGEGIGAGDVVSAQLPNRYEFVVVAVATQSLGAVVNPLLPNYRVRELRNVFETAHPRVVFTPSVYRDCDHRELISEVVASTGIATRQVVVGEVPASGPDDLAAILAAAAPVPLRPGADGAVSELIFTSGTEARPKAIMHTEQTANFSVRVAREDLGVTDDDVVWMPSPLGHSTGFNYGMRFAAYHGLPLVLQDRWDPDLAVDLIETEACSYTLAATTFLRDVVDAARRRRVPLPSMRAFGCGGSPVPPPLVDAAEDLGIGVLRLYGSTEVLVGTWNRPGTAADKRRHTDGPPLTGVEVESRDAEGRPVAAGQEGELYVRGPNTCVGFYADPVRTTSTFEPDGWVRTGDLVTIDSDGFLTVVGRRKEILIRGGLNIAPREIEEMLLEFDEVVQVAVIGLPHERLGERMCACVVLAPGSVLSLEDTVSRLKERGLATYKLPERLEICDALPMTASGKVQKFELVRSIAGSG